MYLEKLSLFGVVVETSEQYLKIICLWLFPRIFLVSDTCEIQETEFDLASLLSSSNDNNIIDYGKIVI